jgi:hypothetical protein
MQKGINLFLRDVTQVYMQLTTFFNRLILACLLKEIRHLYLLGTIIVMRKLLYSIPEAKTH